MYDERTLVAEDSGGGSCGVALTAGFVAVGAINELGRAVEWVA